MKPPDVVPLTIRPVTLAVAKAFVKEHHRHNVPMVGWKFGCALYANGEMAGVGVAGRPVARAFDNGHFIEFTRVCTLPVPNANSKLYGALARAAAALGYCRAYTYTLPGESGASLKAAGWEIDEVLADRPGWDTPSRRRDNDITPEGGRIRWKKKLNDCEDHPMEQAA